MAPDLQNMILVARMTANDVDSWGFEKFQDDIGQNGHVDVVPPGR